MLFYVIITIIVILLIGTYLLYYYRTKPILVVSGYGLKCSIENMNFLDSNFLDNLFTSFACYKKVEWSTKEAPSYWADEDDIVEEINRYGATIDKFESYLDFCDKTSEFMFSGNSNVHLPCPGDHFCILNSLLKRLNEDISKYGKEQIELKNTKSYFWGAYGAAHGDEHFNDVRIILIYGPSFEYNIKD